MSITGAILVISVVDVMVESIARAVRAQTWHLTNSIATSKSNLLFVRAAIAMFTTVMKAGLAQGAVNLATAQIIH